MATDDQIDKLIDSLSDINSSQRDVLKQLLSRSKNNDDLVKQVEKLTKSGTNLDKAIGDLAKKAGLNADQEAALRKKLLQGTQKETTALDRAFAKAGETAKNTGASFASAFASMLGGGEKFRPSQMLQTALSPLVSMAPKIFGPLSAALGFMVGYMEETFDSFRRLTGSGFQAGATLGDLQKAAAATGMTLTQFENFVKTNSQALANFGGGVNDGMDKFTSSFAPILTPLGKFNTQLKELGYSNAELQTVIGSFVETTVASGEAQRLSTDQMTQSAVETLRGIDEVARLTGKSREQIAKDMAAAAKASPDFQTFLQSLGPDKRKQVQLFLEQLPPQMRKAAESAIATGGKQVTQELADMMVAFPQAGQQVMRLAQDFAAGSELTTESAQGLMANAKKEAQDRSYLSEQFRQAAYSGNQSFLKAQGYFAEANEYTVKDLDKLRKGTGGAINPMIRLEQIVDSISQTFRSVFLPLIENSLTPGMNGLADAADNFKEKLKEWQPKLEQFFTGVGERLNMLWDENGRKAVFGEVAGFLKGLMADLVELMSDSLLGRALGASKQGAEAMRAGKRVDDARMALEQAKRGGDQAAIDAAAEALKRAEAEKAAADQNKPGWFGSLFPSSREVPSEGVTAESIPGAASGGILSSPLSGGLAILHGKEAVVPLPDGRSIPVSIQSKTSDSTGNAVNSSNGLGISREMVNQLSTMNEMLSRLLMVNEQQFSTLDRQYRIMKDISPIS